ncbi:MAG: hypothetical protein MRZ79_20595 [Bacteroidia bacterium]|nr:hypothetical protein [Bacteroidia bacterium]
MKTENHASYSAEKFGGSADLYLPIHRFLDGSESFMPHIKHRALLHHTLGMEICTKVFGEFIDIPGGKKVMVRDIAASHIQRNLVGVTPTVADWFTDQGHMDIHFASLPKFDNPKLESFLQSPFLQSNCLASLLITFSDFGVVLVKRVFGEELAKELSEKLSSELKVSELLQELRFRAGWQFLTESRENYPEPEEEEDEDWDDD